MEKKKMLQKDFILVIIGQIISLFGNAILRFALPLYLLNETNSPALFGIVSACSFIPMILLSPVGGIIADRVNKRNVMVILDFSTSAIVLAVTLLLGNVNLVGLMLVALILLYGIQGAYQPAVQASIPALVNTDELMPANAAINLVTSGANLIGPVIGGALFGFVGIKPILMISILCFFCSAVMEIFIKIPFQKRKSEEHIVAIAVHDMKEGLHFIGKENPEIGKVAVLLAGINLFFSTLMIIGIPIIVTQLLGFESETGTRLYGYAQGALAAGGLIGGLMAGVIGKKLKINKAHILLFISTFMLIPIGMVLALQMPAMVSYAVIVISCFFMMLLSSLFTIQMMAYVQMITPMSLIGKVMSIVMCICLCAQPIGQAIYGFLFQILMDKVSFLFFGAAAICLLMSLASGKLFRSIDLNKVETIAK